MKEETSWRVDDVPKASGKNSSTATAGNLAMHRWFYLAAPSFQQASGSPESQVIYLNVIGGEEE